MAQEPRRVRAKLVDAPDLLREAEPGHRESVTLLLQNAKAGERVTCVVAGVRAQISADNGESARGELVTTASAPHEDGVQITFTIEWLQRGAPKSVRLYSPFSTFEDITFDADPFVFRASNRADAFESAPTILGLTTPNHGDKLATDATGSAADVPEEMEELPELSPSDIEDLSRGTGIQVSERPEDAPKRIQGIKAKPHREYRGLPPHREDAGVMDEDNTEVVVSHPALPDNDDDENVIRAGDMEGMAAEAAKTARVGKAIEKGTPPTHASPPSSLEDSAVIRAQMARLDSPTAAFKRGPDGKLDLPPSDRPTEEPAPARNQQPLAAQARPSQPPPPSTPKVEVEWFEEEEEATSWWPILLFLGGTAVVAAIVFFVMSMGGVGIGALWYTTEPQARIEEPMLPESAPVLPEPGPPSVPENLEPLPVSEPAPEVLVPQDADGDGYSDIVERTLGTDPNDPDSHPSSQPEDEEPVAEPEGEPEAIPEPEIMKCAPYTVGGVAMIDGNSGRRIVHCDGSLHLAAGRTCEVDECWFTPGQKVRLPK